MTEAAIQTMVNEAQEPQETPQERLARLAQLPALEYEQVREAEAEALSIRKSVLDAEVEKIRNPQTTGKQGMFPLVEPWPEPVTVAAMLDEIVATIHRFIVCSKDTARAVALWVAFTWVIDFVQVAPLAIITAPEKRCGKSQLLNLILRMARRPLVASNISPSAIFRVIEAYGPTLGLDEADTFMRENEELRGVLNSGHTRQSAYVIRNVGDNHEPTQFSTWGAKALSGIGDLPDTLMDRAIRMELRRKLPHEKVERLRHAEPGLFARLSSKLARFADDAGPAIARARPVLPDALNDRAQDNWEPLLAIADHAGGEWPDLARKAALRLSGTEQDAPSFTAELLADIQTIFRRMRCERIASADLVGELLKDDEAPWLTYNRGKPMTPRQLAKRLGEYGIKSGNVRIGATQAKGYLVADFADVFARYLAPAVPASQSTENEGKPPFSDRTGDVCAFLGEQAPVPLKPVENLACYAGTDKTGGAGKTIAEVTL